MRTPLLVTLALTLALAGCDATAPGDSFIPGEVVARVRYVEPAFVEAYARRHEISVKQTAFQPTFLVQTVVRSGAPGDYLAALSDDPLVDTVRTWRGDGVEVLFRRAADEAYVRELVGAQGGLDIVNLNEPFDLVTFAVPRGQEKRWVARLGQEVFVVHAEQNQTVSLR